MPQLDTRSKRSVQFVMGILVSKNVKFLCLSPLLASAFMCLAEQVPFVSPTDELSNKLTTLVISSTLYGRTHQTVASNAALRTWPYLMLNMPESANRALKLERGNLEHAEVMFMEKTIGILDSEQRKHFADLLVSYMNNQSSNGLFEAHSSNISRLCQGTDANAENSQLRSFTSDIKTDRVMAGPKVSLSLEDIEEACQNKSYHFLAAQVVITERIKWLFGGVSCAIETNGIGSWVSLSVGDKTGRWSFPLKPPKEMKVISQGESQAFEADTETFLGNILTEWLADRVKVGKDK